MIRTRKFALLVVLVLMGLLLAACGGGAAEPAAEEEMAEEEAAPAEEEMADEEMAEEGALPDLGGQEVIIAVENAYPPFNSLDENGNGVGWDYDAGNEICARLNCVPVFTEAAWDGIFPAMAAGEYDVLFDGVTYTEERDETVDFSTPYVVYSEVLLARADEDRWTTPEEFAANEDLIISTQLGTTNYDVAVELVGTDRVRDFEDFGLATEAVLSGDADAVSIDSTAAEGFMGANPDQLKILGEITSDNRLALVFPPGSALIDPFNAALAAMEADGTLADINAKWFQ